MNVDGSFHIALHSTSGGRQIGGVGVQYLVAPGSEAPAQLDMEGMARVVVYQDFHWDWLQWLNCGKVEEGRKSRIDVKQGLIATAPGEKKIPLHGSPVLVVVHVVRAAQPETPHPQPGDDLIG